MTGQQPREHPVRCRRCRARSTWAIDAVCDRCKAELAKSSPASRPGDAVPDRVAPLRRSGTAPISS